MFSMQYAAWPQMIQNYTTSLNVYFVYFHAKMYLFLSLVVPLKKVI